MKTSSLTATLLGLALAVGCRAPRAPVPPVALQVVAGSAMTGPLRELGAHFERASGHTVVFRFGTTPELIKLVRTGGPFDLGIVPREVFKDAAAEAQFTSKPPTDIARVGLGVAVRAGAPKPDIRTAAALKQTLLDAPSVAFVPASAAGAHILRVFERLGIREAMHAKTKAQTTAAQIVEVVARGEAALGVFLLNVLTAPGLELVGPFPAGLQQEVVYTAAVAVDTPNAAAAQAFITYLQTPAAIAVLKAAGMTPG